MTTTLPPIYNIAHPPSVLVKEYLIAQAVGVDPTTSTDDYPIYVSVLPDDESVKDKALAVIDTTPVLQEEWLRNGQWWLRYGIQIIIRDDTYPNGFSKMKAVLDALDSLKYTSLTYDSVTYQIRSFRRTSQFALGQEADKRRRQTFTVNGLLSVIDSSK